METTLVSAHNDNRRPADVLLHWYTLVEGVQFSAQEFYKSLETEIGARRLPRLHTSRVQHREGGVVSDKRIYLRFMRERYAFDVCAAPFGTNFFFSLRLVTKPRDGWLGLILMPLLFYTAYKYLLSMLPRGQSALVTLGYVTLLIVILYRLIAWAYRKEVENSKPGANYLELPDFDGYFLNLPVIGWLYEKIRGETYHRVDTRILFQTFISDLVKRKVDEVACAKGVKLLNAYEYSPLLGELYRRTTTMAPIVEASMSDAVA